MSQWPYQTTDVRDQLRVLGLYVAEQVDVIQVSTGRTGQLRGLPYSQPGDRPKADVLWHLSPEAQADCSADEDEIHGKLLPILYDFEDMATTIILPDGRSIIPACELTNLVREEQGYQSPAVSAKIEGKAGNRWIFTSSCYDTTLSEFSEACLREGKLAGRIENALRQWHFAANLRPDQYHRKTVA